MKITVFTSNQSRHISLIRSLAEVADRVYAIQEGNTVFPGEVADFYKKTPVMQEYFKHVIAAEKEVFGDLTFSPPNARTLSLKDGDLNKLSLDVLQPALESDVYIVFGASFIKGALCDFLVDHKAINIHLGTSPYYRGSSCNFWALYDSRPDYVGATIHYLSKGLDSGDMLFHALPKAEAIDPFVLGMRAVQVAHKGLIERIKSGDIFTLTRVVQDKDREMRYSRGEDFSDPVASEYLQRAPNPEMIEQSLKARDLSVFLNPYIG